MSESACQPIWAACKLASIDLSVDHKITDEGATLIAAGLKDSSITKLDLSESRLGALHDSPVRL